MDRFVEESEHLATYIDARSLLERSYSDEIARGSFLTAGRRELRSPEKLSIVED